MKQRLFANWSLQSKTNLRNSFWGGLDFFVTTGSVFLLIPVLLKTIGQEMFGIMVIVNTIMGFTGLVSFGLGQATLKYVSEFRATGEVHLIREVIRATLVIYTGMGLLACVVGFLSAEWFAAQVFSVSPAQLTDAVLAIKLGAVGFLAFLIFGVGENAWKGFERFDVPVIVRSVARLLTLTGQVVLALSGFGLAWLVGLQVGLFLIAAFIVIYLLKRKAVPDLSFSPFCSFAIIKRVFSYGFFTYISGIFGMLRQNGDTLIVGAILGPAALALYVIPIRLLSQVHGLLARCFGFLFPYAGKLHSLDKIEELKRCYDQATLGISVLAAAMITPLGYFAYQIVDLWLGRDVAVQAGAVMQIIALRFAIFPLSIVNSYFLMATGLVKTMTVIVAINCVVSLGAITFGAYHWGLQGAALGQLSVFLPVLMNRYVIEHKLFGSSDLISVFLVPVVLLIPLIVAFNFDAPNFDVNYWYLLIGAVVVSGLASLITFVILGGTNRIKRVSSSDKNVGPICYEKHK